MNNKIYNEKKMKKYHSIKWNIIHACICSFISGVLLMFLLTGIALYMNTENEIKTYALITCGSLVCVCIIIAIVRILTVILDVKGLIE